MEEESGDILIWRGDSVKALGKGLVGGYLVHFGSTDLSEYRDVFTAETDFDLEEGAGKASVYYAHGRDQKLGKRRLGKATLKMDETGIWAEAQLAMRDEWERRIYELVAANKLAWSSGSATHLVERKSMGEAHHVTHWPIVEASLTPTPAEPHCVAVALKSMTFPDLSAEYEPGVREYEPASLAERTERWLDRGDSLLAGYRQVKDLETKAGRALSAARRARLEEARRLIDDLLSETQPARDEPATTETLPAAGMGAGESSLSEPEGGSPLGSDLYAMLVATEFQGTSWTEGTSA